MSFKGVRISQLSNLIFTGLVDQKLLVVPNTHQARDEIGEPHRTQQVMQAQFLSQSVLGFNEGIVSPQSGLVPVAIFAAAANFID